MSITWWRRLWHLLNRRRFERDLTREMREHRDAMPDPATFGDPHRLLEYSRDAWGWNWLDDGWQDFKAGMRALRRSPAFTVTAILILSFGIGLNLTLYQLANVVVLRPPAVRQPETLARLYRQSPRWNHTDFPYVASQVVARDNTALSAVLLEAWTPVVWGEANGLAASFVSANWFSELGYGPFLGRVFAPELDGLAGAAATVVVSHEFWRADLGSDPAVIGTTVLINKRPATLIGVMPATFPGIDRDQTAVWLPISQREHYFPDSPFLRAWDSANTTIYGRLKDGVSPQAAREMLRSTMAAIHREQPEHFAADEWLEPAMGTANFMLPAERLQMLGVMSLLGALSSLVLLVAAANLGNLVLSRATVRARELGVRIALGARRSRIVRQLLIETMPLGLAGAVCGLIFANWAANLVALLADLPPYLDFGPDWQVVLVGLGLGALALAVAGALPAWKVAQQELAVAIKDGGQQVSMRLDRANLRRLMVAIQVAGSCVLLVVAAMTARGLQQVLTSDLGFKYEQSAALAAGLGGHGITGDAARAYWATVKERVRANPETLEAALVLAPPLGGRVHETGYGDAPGLRVIANHVEPVFFSLMEIPLLAGRTFDATDSAATAVIISRRLAEQMYGSLDVLGKGFPRTEPTDTIIGVAGDAASIRLGATGVAELYRPLADADYEDVVLIARARSDPARLLPVLRAAAVADPRVFPEARLLRDDFERQVFGTRMASGIAVSVGLLTLGLACIGIFGVVSYGVALRTKEIGIHLALGARRSAVFLLVMRQVVSPVSLGMLAGIAAAAPIGMALARSPLQVQSTDPLAYLTGLLVFVMAAAIAAIVPAMRALKADPLRSLRYE